MNNQKKIITKNYVFLGISIILVILTTTIILLIQTITNYQDNRFKLEREVIHNYEEQYQTILYCYRLLAQSYYNDIFDNERILEIIWQANDADENEKQELRNELFKLSITNYELAINNKFRQYHFVLKDNTSFLRMHKPEKYGDNLLGIRESVRIANQEGVYVEGFEEGRVFNGYRFEFPLFYNDELVGCVEVSLSYAAVTELMKELYDTRAKLLVKKEYADDKVWDDLIESNYSPVTFTDNYYIDDETRNQNPESENLHLLELIDDDRIDLGQTFFLIISQNDIDYGVVFLSIQNINGNHAAYLVFANECTQFKGLFESLFSFSFGIITNCILIIFIILYFIFHRIKMEQLTYYDHLTGAKNRNSLFESIKKEIDRNKRYMTDFSIILFDIDKFKQINDNFGHLVGDHVLKMLSNSVETHIRSIDTLFRFGGDEFLILLPNTTVSEAKLVSEKLKTFFMKEQCKEINQSISISTGIVQFNGTESAQDLIHRADLALYHEKEQKA